MADDNARLLRAVSDESVPLSRDELQTHGNELLLKARYAALDALQASTKPAIIYKPRSYDVYEVRRMRDEANEAVRAWTAVVGALAELLNEFDKSNRAARIRGGVS